MAQSWGEVGRRVLARDSAGRLPTVQVKKFGDCSPVTMFEEVDKHVLPLFRPVEDMPQEYQMTGEIGRAHV